MVKSHPKILFPKSVLTCTQGSKIVGSSHSESPGKLCLNSIRRLRRRTTKEIHHRALKTSSSKNPEVSSKTHAIGSDVRLIHVIHLDQFNHATIEQRPATFIILSMGSSCFVSNNTQVLLWAYQNPMLRKVFSKLIYHRRAVAICTLLM